MFARQPRLPIDFELELPIDVLGDNYSKTKYVHKLKQRLNFAYKKSKRNVPETGSEIQSIL